jgi:D-sedoheptulose 7-phosphate isomerase
VSVEELYPFLYAGGGNAVADVLAEVRRSTADKAAEIVALRQRIAADYADRLDACAAALAGSFRAGGRMFTFGNGGSSSDAQAVAQLFLDPGSGIRALPAVALTTDVAVVTALSNDVGFEVVFAR